MAVLVVDKADLCNAWYDIADAERAADMINSLCDALDCGDYHEGQRNNMAVDLTCLCHVLELDPIDVATCTSLGTRSIMDLRSRVNVIKGYLESWDKYGVDGVFDYMLMKNDWLCQAEREWVVLN